ncbi:MAG TPA: Na(+)/H(+) antiporter subunit B [Bacillota bacterium]
MYRTNNLILRTTTSLIAFILLGFAIYLLLAGHNSPGGGFVGGLVTSAAVILMYMAYGTDVIDKVLPFSFRTLIPIGLLLAILTGLGSFFFNVPFLTHTFGEVYIPIIGNVELATAMIFDLGVYFTVLGATITIILNIAHDR